MEIYLIRHTKVRNDHNVCYGDSEVSLADSFINEVAELRSLLPGGVEEFYSSPSVRCTQLAMELNMVPLINERLKEMNFGDWEGRPWNEIPGSELDPWMNDFVNIAPPNGESLIDLFSRVNSFYTDRLAGKNKPVMIFTHAGVIRCFYALLGNVELKDIFKVQVDQGSVHRLTG